MKITSALRTFGFFHLRLLRFIFVLEDEDEAKEAKVLRAEQVFLFQISVL